jgi:hypothetical protein
VHGVKQHKYDTIRVSSRSKGTQLYCFILGGGEVKEAVRSQERDEKKKVYLVVGILTDFVVDGGYWHKREITEVAH